LELFSLNYKHYVRIRGSVIISVRERKFQRTKVPEDESSTYGTFVPGNDSSRVRKFHESISGRSREGGCILKHVKILHENALFLHKFFKNFLGRRQSTLHRSHPLPFRPLYFELLDPPLPYIPTQHVMLFPATARDNRSCSQRVIGQQSGAMPCGRAGPVMRS